MKDIFAVIGVLFIGALLFTGLSTDSTIGDDAIKDKIEIIALAENSDDPAVKAQAESAKLELAEIKAAKDTALIEQKQAALDAIEEEKQAEISRQEFEKSPESRYITLFYKIALGFLFLGFLTLMVLRLMRHNRTI